MSTDPSQTADSGRVIQPLDRQGQYVASVVERIDYKPGWKFHVEPCVSVPGWLYLVARSTEPESRGGGERYQWRTFVVAAHHNIPHILASVRNAIKTWELHELDEWLRFDGERLHDPHACAECFVGVQHHILEEEKKNESSCTS